MEYVAFNKKLTETMEKAIKYFVYDYYHNGGDPQELFNKLIELGSVAEHTSDEHNIVIEDDWKLMHTHPKNKEPFLALDMEYGDMFKTTFDWEDEDSGNLYYSYQCGQPVVQDAEKTHWRKLPKLPPLEMYDNDL